MKLINPIIYVPHKVDGEWAKSAFSFDGTVDKRRVKREIYKSFKRGGQKVSMKYIDACIAKSLNMKMMELPDDSKASEDNGGSEGTAEVVHKAGRDLSAVHDEDI